jgi:hypothetical protein
VVSHRVELIEMLNDVANAIRQLIATITEFNRQCSCLFRGSMAMQAGGQ